MTENLLKSSINQLKQKNSFCYLLILSCLPINMLRLLTYYIYFLNGQVILCITLIIFFNSGCFYDGEILSSGRQNNALIHFRDAMIKFVAKRLTARLPVSSVK